MTISRAFLNLPDGQVHYRQAGKGRPVLLTHASPGSSRQLVSLISALANDFHVIAPDTGGNGDSDPLPIAQPKVVDYAERLVLFLDAMKIDNIDVYGSHTGAAIAAELAILAPDRIGKLILDGVGVFSPEQRDAHLEHYAPPFTPDLDGAYLTRAFHFCRDQYLFYPWYDRTPQGRRDGGLRPASELHTWLVEVLKANETYPLAYHAAFRWAALDRLRLVAQPTLVMAALDDPLIDGTRGATPVMPNGRFEPLPGIMEPDFGQRRADLITDFLKA